MELLPVGSWEVCRQGSDIAILAIGPFVYTALDAAEKLYNDEGVNVEVINCRFIKPMDIACLDNIQSRFTYVITVEEGIINGGFGDGVAAWLLENNFSGRLKRLGLPDSFVEHGSRDEILNSIGLSVSGLIDTVKEILVNNKVPIES
tara:strand:- start:11 stop:451 length:441 start_codon:yes stop_codon:yes gene_type:complete